MVIDGTVEFSNDLQFIEFVLGTAKERAIVIYCEQQ
jgi:hypothetical protein